MHLIVPDNCTNCRFVYSPDGGASFFCRRHPPEATMIPGQHGPITLGIFPPVSSEILCGEYKRVIIERAA